MKLKDLLQFVPYEKVIGDTNIEIGGLCIDSEKIIANDLFICYKGSRVDSHKYIKDAVAYGAVAVVCEKVSETSVTQIIVKNGRESMCHFARAFYGNPQDKLKLIAVTGTNGKTTTTYMLAEIFKAQGYKVGIIGTLGILYGDKVIAPELTTPDPIFLYDIFHDMVSVAVDYVMIEVSAHAIALKKIEGLEFECGIFTNCTQDHLDFFGDMETYRACKKSFFEKNVCKMAIINTDDVLGTDICKNISNAITYGLDNPSDAFAVEVECGIKSSRFVANIMDEICDIKINFPAIYNVYNALAAATCAAHCGVTMENIACGLRRLKGVTGRLERVANYHGANIYVDYAHTPDGLKNVLSSLREVCEGKLYCLFGCGGNRDKSKRPIMGKISITYADFVVLTSDNPRYEDPYDIISDVEEGMRGNHKKYVTITDRATATEYILKLLSEKDILLVAGKGGEEYQEIMGIKHYYNDNNVIKNLIG